MSSNRNPDTPTPSYTMGYSDEFAKLLDRRNAGINATHLLPYLKPGLRVLDLGCGPGTISVGLAKVVEPRRAAGHRHGRVSDQDSPGCRYRRRARQRGLPDGRRDPSSLLLKPWRQP